MTDGERLDFIEKYQIELAWDDWIFKNGACAVGGWSAYSPGHGSSIGRTPREVIDDMAACIANNPLPERKP